LFEVYFAQFHCKNSLATEHSSAYKAYQFIAKILYKKVKVLTVPTTLDADEVAHENAQRHR
jgi:hypothetical protein